MNLPRESSTNRNPCETHTLDKFVCCTPRATILALANGCCKQQLHSSDQRKAMMSVTGMFRQQSRRVVFIAWVSYHFAPCRLEISPESIKSKRTKNSCD